MKNLPWKMNLTVIASYVLFALSIIIALTTAYFIYSIDVLKDWRIVLPNQEVHAGDTIVVESRYTKLQEVTGVSKRYLDCETRDGVSVSYPISEAVADRKAGTTKGTGVDIAIPNNIPNLPTFCKIRISITYPVLPFRIVLETQSSPEFELLPPRDAEKATADSSIDNSSTTQTSPSQAVAPSRPSSSSSSSVNNTPAPSPSQSNSTPQTSEPIDNRSVIDRTLDGVSNLIRGIEGIL